MQPFSSRVVAFFTESSRYEWPGSRGACPHAPQLCTLFRGDTRRGGGRECALDTLVIKRISATVCHHSLNPAGTIKSIGEYNYSAIVIDVS